MEYVPFNFPCPATRNPFSSFSLGLLVIDYRSAWVHWYPVLTSFVVPHTKIHQSRFVGHD